MTHSFSLCIVSFNQPELLEATLKSIKKYLPCFRSTFIVKNKKYSNNVYQSYKIINIKQCIKKNPKGFLELTFQKIKSRNVWKCFLIFEGEILVGKEKIEYFDKDKDIELIKIINPKSKSYIWHPRIINLKNKVNIETNDSSYPVIKTNCSKLFKLDKDLYIINSPFLKISYSSCHIFDLANKYLLDGEVNKCLNNLNSVSVKDFNTELKARYYFLLGYCKYLKGANYIILESILKYSYTISKYTILEPLFLLLIAGLKEGQETRVIKLIEKYKNSLNIQNVPPYFVLSYKKEIYQYMYLYLVYYCSFHTKHYSILFDTLSSLIERIHTPNNIKAECILILEKIRNKLCFNRDIVNNFLYDKNQPENITLSFKKNNKIDIQLVGYKDDKINILTNNIGNTRCMKGGWIFNKAPFSKIKLIYQNKQQSILRIHDDSKNIFIDTPILYLNNNISIINYLNHKPDQYSLCHIYCNNSESNKIENSCLLGSAYQRLCKTVVLHGNGDLTDYISIIYCFLNGNNVLYSGCNNIYLDLLPMFGDYIKKYNNDTNIKFQKESKIDLISKAYALSLFEILTSRYLNYTTKHLFSYFVEGVSEYEDNMKDLLGFTSRINPVVYQYQGFTNIFLYQIFEYIIQKLSIYHNIVVLDNQLLKQPRLFYKFILKSDNIRFRNISFSELSFDKHHIILFQKYDYYTSFLQWKQEYLEQSQMMSQDTISNQKYVIDCPFELFTLDN